MREPRAYYNEFNKRKAQTLRNLIAENLIPPGDVDERDIRDVRPEDLRGYAQCHFFAGIGGWPLGLRIAGWPDHRPAWTGSCPCQPFSKVNAVHRQRKGRADARHLLPEWLRLIREIRPGIIFGEQVKAAIELGWLDEAFDGLEQLDYACKAVIAPAVSVGTPQERERLWIVCDTDGERLQGVSWPRTYTGASEALNPWRETARTGSSYRGKIWLTKPGLCLLADGLPGSVAALHDFGDAIVPQVAAEIIGAYLDAESDRHFQLSLEGGIFA